MILVPAGIGPTSAAQEGSLLGPLLWPEPILLLLAAGGLVATARQIVMAAAALVVVLVGWQVARYGWRGVPLKTADRTGI